MEVVCHHIGTPRRSMTAQNEDITKPRNLIASGFSGGGSFLAIVAGTSVEVFMIFDVKGSEGASAPFVSTILR
jgi:hypothetical protein